MTQPFRVLVADCPWDFDQKKSSADGKFHGTVGDHYETLSVENLCKFPLPDLADDAHLFQWRVASMQQEALDVTKAWDFTVKSELVWLKRTTTYKRHFGMGRQVRMEHEVCLIATRGRGARTDNKSIRSTFMTEEVIILPEDDHGGLTFEAVVPGRKHSKKPPEFYAIVEQLCHGPYVELFSREQRPGWTCYGNELDPSHHVEFDWFGPVGA